MKTAKYIRLFLLFTLIFCCLTACEKDDETLSPLKEVTLEGEASSIDINISRSNWYIASIATIEGWPVYDENNHPLYLADLGSLRFNWGSIIRDRKDLLTVKLNDNFDKEDRVFIINLKTQSGLYTESITIRQKQCQSFYQIESIAYTLEEGDGIKEAAIRPWGITWINKNIAPGEITSITFYPIHFANVEYRFEYNPDEFSKDWINSEGDNRSVDMPKDIKDGKIIFEPEKKKFTDNSTYFYEEMGKAYERKLVGWKRNRYFADLYYKQLQVTYTLTLSRPGKETVNIIKGKLIKEYPYDSSIVFHEINDLEEGD
ncbi:hypothetical protein [Bacteroides sp.]|uniref:hypothetical protein n=1 Tax=Bacteroides sp. TaxID=29523 RepID=UPI002639694A|nr:hypothetical protein [Bacteroides sp.]